MKFRSFSLILAVISLAACDGIGSSKPDSAAVARVYGAAWGKSVSPHNIQNLQCVEIGGDGIWQCTFTQIIPASSVLPQRRQDNRINLKKTSSGWVYAR